MGKEMDENETGLLPASHQETFFFFIGVITPIRPSFLTILDRVQVGSSSFFVFFFLVLLPFSLKLYPFSLI